MKSLKLVAVFMFSLLCSGASAQDFTGGLKVGFDLSQIDGDQLSGYHKGGLIAGGFINRSLGPKLNWQMEMFYITKGSKKGINPEKNQLDYMRIAVNYIEVPMLLQFWMEKLKINFELGLSFSALVTSKEENGDGETTIIGPFRPFGFGSLAGLNYAFSDQLSGTARISYSLSPIAVDNKVLFTIWNRFGGSYNNVLEFALNYHIQSKE